MSQRRPDRRDRSRRPNATGRSDKVSRFIQLPHRIYQSEAVCSLNPNARALLAELVMLDFGRNNGSIYLSVRDATDRLGYSDMETAMRAFEDLEDRGLIALTKDAHFDVKAADNSRARCWRLTWLPWPEGPKGKRAPTNEWEHYLAPAGSPERKRANRRLEALARYRSALSANKMPVRDSLTTGDDLDALNGKTVRESLTAKRRD